MTTLAEFLLARVAEDEVGAREGMERRRAEALATASAIGVSYMTFGGPFDPARALAECAAKRAIVDDFRDLHEQYRSSHSEHLEGRRFQALIAVGQLALAYADHPDWREDFRP